MSSQRPPKPLPYAPPKLPPRPSRALSAVDGAGFTAKWGAGTKAVAFAAVIGVGCLTGALLKTDKQTRDAKKQYAEASVDDRIAMLEERKRDIIRKKAPVEEKLSNLRARMEEESKKEHL